MMPDFYRLERTLRGERLVAVDRPEEATHAGIALVRRLAEDRLREVAALRGEAERLRQRLQALDAQLAHAVHTTDQAQMAVARHEQETTRAQSVARKLAAKNAELIGEKRRIRDQLIAKHPLPAIHYRIDIDREDQARQTITLLLDTFPHPDKTGEALAEARRQAERRGGQLRQLRLDTVAWRALVQLPVDD